MTRTVVCADAKYITGASAAGKVNSTEPRRSHLRAIFGHDMIGTFNVEVSRKFWFRAAKHRKAALTGFWERRGEMTPIRFFLCSLSRLGRDFMCWAVLWHNVRTGERATMELFSKEPIPDHFKANDLVISVYDQWGPEQTEAWVPTYKKWFQSFSWGPQRSDNEKVWSRMAKFTKWGGKKVLDIGCNTGWYSLRAAKEGAYVDAYDINKKTIQAATVIGRHIEQQDVNFGMKDPGGNYDIILYLSVHHQVDKEYRRFRKKVDELKERCKLLFVEAISPAPHTRIQIPDLGRRPTMVYEHKVRGVRKLFALDGKL